MDATPAPPARTHRRSSRTGVVGKLVVHATVVVALAWLLAAWRKHSDLNLVLDELSEATDDAMLLALSLVGLGDRWLALRSDGATPRHYFKQPASTHAVPEHALLDALAAGQMDWTQSTTPVPISTHSPTMKWVLGGDRAHVPPALWHLTNPKSGVDVAAVHPVREYYNALRYPSLVHLCGGHPATDACRAAATFADPVFGITPLHLARAQGDDRAAQLLLNLGADPGALDLAGRAPGNLSFTHFVTNSRKWAKDPNECAFPVVDASDPADLPNLARLVLEGEPLLLRNFMPAFAPDVWAQYRDLDAVVAQHREAKVRFGQVPYADYFGLETGTTTLGDFYDRFVRSPPSGDAGAGAGKIPQYVFQKHSELTASILPVLERLVASYFPVARDGGRLICPPSFAGTGNASIHYFVGAPGSGAPFHIHADAVNVNLVGTKEWYVTPPLAAPYSRVPVSVWLREGKDGIDHPDKALKCTQRAGDAVYVPFDWAHAVVNRETNFGVALELLNRRDTFVAWPWGDRFIQC
ncbi:hypothetical protein H9P43_003317 [Blastocladiella emersonii ATCC 22665]|nr:hypothetical protein H9P43_003317 [Blastocladiella emersonii ATCC 22665]